MIIKAKVLVKIRNRNKSDDDRQCTIIYLGASKSTNMENVPTKNTRRIEQTKNGEAVPQEIKTHEIRPDELQRSTHFADYEKNGVIEEQPFTASTRASRVLLPVYTIDWTSRTDSYFLPVNGLDFLIGVPEVLLLQMTSNLKSYDSTFVVKIPNGETLYLGVENSTSLQRALFCSQRSFNMAFLDPNKHEAVTFIRKAALTSLGTFFRQELVAILEKSSTPLGRIQQDNSLSDVSFTVLDEQSKQIYRIVGSESTIARRLNHDVHFNILDPVDRTGGVILHKWDNNQKDLVYHIVFPSRETLVQHKMLLIGVALLVEYTYFKTTGCFSFV